MASTIASGTKWTRAAASPIRSRRLRQATVLLAKTGRRTTSLVVTLTVPAIAIGTSSPPEAVRRHSGAPFGLNLDGDPQTRCQNGGHGQSALSCCYLGRGDIANRGTDFAEQPEREFTFWVADDSIEVEGVPELHTEPDTILVHVELRRRRSSGALSQERVPAEEGYVVTDLIGRRESQRERLDLDLLRLSGAQRVRNAVRGGEHDQQAPIEARQRERAGAGLSIGGPAEATRHAHTPRVLKRH